jgi:hypothetical protein
MKFTLWISSLALAAGIAAGTAGIAAAQSDRTLGINCTVAGHAHCGESGPIFGSRRLYNFYGWHRWHRHHDWRHRRY